MQDIEIKITAFEMATKIITDCQCKTVETHEEVLDMAEIIYKWLVEL